MTDEFAREFPLAWEAIRAGVAGGVAPGMVAGAWRAAEPDRLVVGAHGKRRLAIGGLSELPVAEDTVFDLASLSKVLGTATLAARLVDRGWIAWDTPLAALLPAAAWPGITLAHLLSHTAGFVAWEPLWERLRERFGAAEVWRAPVRERQEAMRELVLRSRPEALPGERAVYSDISFLLLGFALEEVTGLPLDQAVRRWVWEPMGLSGLHYHHVTVDASRGRREEVAATEDCPWRGGVVQGQVHDDNCWAMGGYAGHAGAFGTVRDVLGLARALFPRKGYAGFLSPATLAMAWTRVRVPAGCSRTLGWDTPSGDEPSVSRLFSARSVGHLGFTGTSLWIDPEAGVAVALLSNRVHPSRENWGIRAFRPRFHEAVRRDWGRGLELR